jgi:hypothetical protein
VNPVTESTFSLSVRLEPKAYCSSLIERDAAIPVEYSGFADFKVSMWTASFDC